MRNSGLRQRLASLVLRLGGWTAEGVPPDLPKYVIVAAPHTWWWDGFWMVAFAWRWGLRINWLVKSTAARYPFGALLRALGAIPVDRSSPQGLVSQLTAEFGERLELLLSISPEGTRARRDYWKSGFYQVARAANVPVCLSYLDYGRMKGGFGPCFLLTGDMHADMNRIRAFYRDVRGRVPEQFTPPRLREEDAAGSGDER